MYTILRQWHIPQWTAGRNYTTCGQWCQLSVIQELTTSQKSTVPRKRRWMGMEGIQPTLYNPHHELLQDTDLLSMLCLYFESFPMTVNTAVCIVMEVSMWWATCRNSSVKCRRDLSCIIGSKHFLRHMWHHFNPDIQQPPPFPLQICYISDCILPVGNTLLSGCSSLSLTRRQSVEYELQTSGQSISELWHMMHTTE